MSKLLKKVKRWAKKVDKARTFGDWKFKIRIKLPRKNNEYYHELERDCAKRGDFYYGIKKKPTKTGM